jgi:sulfite exporter TauE/SafE
MSDTAPLGFGLAFLAGLLGSGHCLGMCGGLVSGCFMRLGAAARRPVVYAAYHGARLAIYALVGLVAAGLGQVLLQAGRFGFVQGVLQIVAGVVVIVLGLDILGKLPFSIGVGFAPVAWSQRLFVVALERDPIRGALFAGAANGLMPCSLTMAMAFKAATAPDALQGAALMLAFGAGTLPSMLAVGLLFARLSATTRSRLLAAGAVLVIGMGVALLIQGLGYTRVMAKLVF